MLRSLTFGQCTFETTRARIAPDAEVHFALLLTLATASRDGVTRDAVVERLWPDAPLEYGRHCLRQSAYRLRQLGVPVRAERGGIMLEWESADVDVHDLLFGSPPQERLVQLGGLPFLPGYVPALGEPFSLWLEALRARVATRLRRALSEEVTATRREGRFHEMGRLARALLSLDPLNEVGTTGLAEAMVLEGSKVEAVRLLEDYEREVGAVSADLRLPVRVLRRRVCEVLDDSLMLRRFEIPFVGRTREFAALRGMLRDAKGGVAQAVFLTGEGGVGKSRLADELLRLAALDGVTLARYTPSAGDTLTPISTLVALGRILLTLPGALGCDAEQLSYVRRLGVPDSETTWNVTGLSAEILYAQLVYAFAELMSAIAEEAPLLLFVDDADRLHPTTWRVLMDVWDRVAGREVFLVLAARQLPEWFGTLGARSCELRVQHLVVYPLSLDDAYNFLRRWSDRNGVPFDEETGDALVRLALGNTYYLSELAAHVARGGEPTQMPPSIRELVTSQQYALRGPARRLLLAVAVLEQRATTPRLTKLLELRATAFVEAVDELEASGLVLSNGQSIWCRHRLVTDVARSRARGGALRYLHARSAALLEEEADRTDSVELLGDCVTHWEEAGDLRRAYEAAMKLGYRLVGMGMGEEAERAFCRAEGVSQSPADKSAAICGQMVSSHLSARWEQVLVLDEKRRRLNTEEQPSAPFGEADLLVAEAGLFSSFRPPDPQQLRELVASKELDTHLRVRLSVLLAIFADNYFEAQVLEEAVASASPLFANSTEPSGELLLAAIYHSTIGDRVAARAVVPQLASVARDSVDYSWRLLGLRRAAECAVRSLNPAAAIEWLQEGVELARDLKLPVQMAACLDRLVYMSIALDRMDDANDYLERLRNVEAGDPRVIERYQLGAEALLAWHGQLEDLSLSVYSRSTALLASPVPRAEQALLTIQSSSALLSGREIEDRAIPRLLALHRRGRAFGGQDFPTAVLLSLLRVAGLSRQATALRRAYLSRWRRESYPIPSTLAGLA